MIGTPLSSRDTWPETPEAEPSLVVDVDGFEGPLDLLLDLARSQKVDLAQISILRLADQYLAFIANARALRLELAADYLVMAAWLAFLKSRLLLPVRRDGAPAPTADDMAAALALRLKRLEGVRALAALLQARYEAGLGRLPPGRQSAPQGKAGPLTATLHDLVMAYAGQRRKASTSRVRIGPRYVLSLADARERLERMLGISLDWLPLDALLTPGGDARARRSTRASGFAAIMELVREGHVELRQEAAFAPLLLRRAPAATLARVP